MRLTEQIHAWYRGAYVPPPPNDPDSAVYFISAGYYEQPLLAKALGIGGRFWLAHWKWIVGTFIAVVTATHMFR